VLAWLLGSLAVHAALMALLLLQPSRPMEDRELPAPAIDIVFEGGRPERAAAEPPPGVAAPPAPPNPAPPSPAPPSAAPPAPAPPPPAPPPVPPAPSAVPPPPTGPAPVAPPPRPSDPRIAALPPAPPANAPLPPAAAPGAPPQVPPLAAPPPTSPAAPVAPPIAVPAVPPAPEPAPPQAAEPPVDFAETLPPGPPLRLRQRYEPAPTPRAQPPAAVMPPGVTWAPGGVQLVPPAGRPQARGLDLTVDPRLVEGLAAQDPSVRVTGAQVGADWRAAFRRWLDQNMRYHPRAIELGESGTVRVQVVAAPDGRVLSVRLTGPSVSPSLNFGTTFPFSGASLPAFPPPADPNGVTIDLTVNYRLIRR
jgi:outer membrane biosynthesis protein TonB